MADHLFEPETARMMVRQHLGPGEVILGVDPKIDRIFDIDDATKVRRSGDRIVDIGKEIEEYDAIDTGMFLCTPALFDDLDRSSKDGNCSLSDGMRRLARDGTAARAGDRRPRWHDLDTPEAFAHADAEEPLVCCVIWRLRGRLWGRLAAALIGLLLLAHLVRRAGPAQLWQGIASVGWGLVLVIALAGLSQAVRTWAWRLTLRDARRRPSFGRMFALRLASEAAGQVGVFGQVFGDTWRVAGLGADLPHRDANYFRSAGSCPVYTLSSTIVTIAGVIALAFVLPLHGKIALYAKVFGFVLVAIVALAVFAVRRRWRLISGPAAALAHIGSIRPWVEGKRDAIQSVEDRLLDFFHYSPGAFRKNLALQLAGQVGCGVGSLSGPPPDGPRGRSFLSPRNRGSHEAGQRD